MERFLTFRSHTLQNKKLMDIRKIILSITILSGISISGAIAQCVVGNCHTGYGTFIWQNADRYRGEWKEGLPHGEGTYKFNNGDHYAGEFVDGKKTGKGNYTWANGDTYIGFWQDDQMHFNGRYTWREDDSYYHGVIEMNKLVQSNIQAPLETPKKDGP